MRQDAPGSLLTAPLREPRHVVAIIYPTGSLYFTSKVGMTNVPGQVTYGALKDIESTSQQLYPEEGRATIGSMSFSVVDLAGAVTALIRSQLQTFEYGIRDREVRVWTGDADDYNLLTRVETYVIDDVVELDQRSYRFSCSDRNREMRDDIFEQVGTRLTQTYTPGDSTLIVQSTAGFEMLQHTAAFTDAPSSTVGYVRLRKTGEVLRYTGKNDQSFTGCVGERFGTIAQEIIVDPATDEDRLPEVEEFIYLEMPGPQLLYAVQTGTVLGTAITLPEHWHLGIATTSINDALYTAVGTDLFDPGDHSKGLILRFTHLEKVDGKRFCEEQLHVPMMTYGPIDALGRIGLRRIVPLLSSAAPVAVLSFTNVKSYSAVVHNQARVINEVVFDWNYDGEEYTRTDVLFNTDSIVRFGRGERREYEFAGLYVSRHSRATIQRIMDALTDRFGAPPIELEVQLQPSTNALEIGDAVLLQLPEVRDYAGADTLNRVFEIQAISRNWVTGEVSARLFGSTARISPQVDANLAGVLSDAWLTGTGTALNTVLTMSGDHVTANGNLVAGTYFHDGDVIIDAGVIITINDNAQLRYTGELTVNGKIDGKGRGLAAIADPNTVGQPIVVDTGGPVQTFGSTRGSFGLIYISASGLYAGTGLGPARAGMPALPRFALATVSGELLGMPAELRGTPGIYGFPVVESAGGAQTVRAKGGAGGAGGAGLALIGRGLSFGVAGEIDLSGNDGGAPAANVTLGGHSLRPGTGGGGSSGGLLVVLDGDNLPLPDLTDALTVTHGATAQTGNPIDFRWTTDSDPADPWTGQDAGVGAVDQFDGAQMVQYAPRDLTLASTDDEIVPAPASLTADADGVSVILTWIPPPEALYDYVEIWESINNDRVNAVRVALVRGSSFETASDTEITRYYWIRASKIGRGVSTWEPVSSTGAVTATFGGSSGAPGQDAVEIAVTASASLQFVQAPDGGAWSHSQVDVTFVFKRGGVDIATHVIRFTRTDATVTGVTQSETGETTAEAFVGNGTASVTVIVTHVATGIAGAQAVTAVQGGSSGESFWTPVLSANMQRIGKVFLKSGGGSAWNAGFYSAEKFGSCTASFQPHYTDKQFMIGLDQDPAEDHDFDTIRFAMFCHSDGTLWAYQDGAPLGQISTYAIDDALTVQYDGVHVRWTQNGAVLHTVLSAGQRFAIDSSFFHVDARANNVSFSVNPGGRVQLPTGVEGELPLANENIAARGWQFDATFSSTDADTVAWTSGTLRSADGSTYSIASGNTGNMGAATFIYLDTNVSHTVLQTATAPENAIGSGRVMVAVANPGTGQATFQVFGGKGGVKIAADSIVANSITANEIAATITWSKDFVVAANGKIRQGKTSSDDLTAGIYIGYDGVGSYDLHIGDETNALKWDGSAGTLVLMGRFFRTDAVIAPGGGLDQLLAYFQMSGNTNSVSFVTIKRFTPDFTGTFNLFATVSTSAGTGDWEITRNGTQILFGDNQITTTPQNLGGQVTNSNVDDWYEFRVRHNTGGGSSVNYSNPRIEGLRNDLGRWT